MGGISNAVKLVIGSSEIIIPQECILRWLGYFSSNREGNDDIYQAIAVCGVDATVVVKDAETGKLLSGASVTFVDQKGKNKGNQESNDMGETKFGVACDEIANFNATRAGYQNGTASMPKSKNGAQNIVINLTPIQPIITETEVILQSIYFEYNQSNITAQGAGELRQGDGTAGQRPWQPDRPGKYGHIRGL